MHSIRREQPGGMGRLEMGKILMSPSRTTHVQKTLIIWGCLCLSTLVGAQEHSRPTSADENAKISVEASLYEAQAAGLYSGFAEKSMSRLGDRVAVILIQSHNVDDLAAQKNGTLAIAQLLHMAFVDPKHINRKDDKIPRVSLLLAKYLFLTAKSVSEKRDLQTVIDELSQKTSGGKEKN
jgi:hypothetical protein